MKIQTKEKVISSLLPRYNHIRMNWGEKTE